MTKNDLTNLILTPDKKIFSIVGPNASGKSYYLNNDLLNALPNGVLTLDEEGRFYTKDNRRKVKIYEDNYIYEDESNRGTNNRNIEQEKIDDNSLKIIEGVKSYKGKFENAKKSLGSKKILNILNALLSYNLNQIDYFLFDEPENSLDDERIRCIGRIFDLLIKNNKRVVFITHSPRLLEVLQIDINNIFLFPKIYSDVINYSFEDVVQIYNKNGENLRKINSNPNNNEYKNYDYLPNTGIAPLYLNEFLKSNDFYRALFYSHIILVEGITEELLARELSNELELSRCIVNSHGKYRMPFLFNLFSLFCDKITCIIDSDYKNGNETFTKKLTEHIETFKENNKYFVYTLPNDIESFLKVDKKELALLLSNKSTQQLPSKSFLDNFSNRYKPYLTLYTIKENDEARKKVKALFDNANNEFEFK